MRVRRRMPADPQDEPGRVEVQRDEQDEAELQVGLRRELAQRPGEPADAREDQDLAEQRRSPATRRSPSACRARASRAPSRDQVFASRPAARMRCPTSTAPKNSASTSIARTSAASNVPTIRDWTYSEISCAVRSVSASVPARVDVVGAAQQRVGGQQQLQRPHDEVQQRRQRDHAERRQERVVADRPDDRRERSDAERRDQDVCDRHLGAKLCARGRARRAPAWFVPSAVAISPLPA